MSFDHNMTINGLQIFEELNIPPKGQQFLLTYKLK